MDFLGGALPNVMFIIGILAIGLGLGIELKLVPLNKEIDKTGRIGAMVVGAILVVGSLYIYLNPALTSQSQTAPATGNAALAPVVGAPANDTQAGSGTPASSAPAVPTPANLPIEAAAEAPAAMATPVPTATPEPSATPVPTSIPPTEAPGVAVPDVHDLSEKEAQDALSMAGLQARKVEQCTGTDQGDSKARKHRIQCQNPAADVVIPLGTTVEYVLR